MGLASSDLCAPAGENTVVRSMNVEYVVTPVPGRGGARRDAFREGRAITRIRYGTQPPAAHREERGGKAF